MQVIALVTALGLLATVEFAALSGNENIALAAKDRALSQRPSAAP